MQQKILLFVLILLLGNSWRTEAQCDIDQTEITLTLEADLIDFYFTVYAYNPSTFQYDLNDAIYEPGTYSFCVDASTCYTFYVNYGGFESPSGTYSLSYDGAIIAENEPLDWFIEQYVGCPEGSMCATPITITGDITTSASVDNTWYEFTAPQNGTWNISTCDNACDTRVYIYENCPWNMPEGPEGTYIYNDNADCGLMANTNVNLEAGHTYLIRIGDSNNNCTGDIQFTWTYLGPVVGCMDNTACNYDPLASEDDGSCLYFPNENCSSPDLVMNVETLLSSMYMTTVQASSCDVVEGLVTGDGERTVLTFGVRIDNIGEEDYYIGDPTNNPEMFETQNCHGHTHYAGYGDYRLMDMQGNIIPAGHKNGFCVMDLCGFGQYNCGMMGISAGCYDEYGPSTSGQWFDLTDVPNGIYHGLVTVNPLHLPDALGRQEMDYENNTYTFCLEISTNGDGVRTFQLLGDGECPAFVDCLGVENGTAKVDCEGNCNGSAAWGDIASNDLLDTDDIPAYLNVLGQQNIPVTTCTDLSGNGSITIYDAYLARRCQSDMEVPGADSQCDFPHNTLSTSNSCGLAIAGVNFEEQYIDVELKTTMYNVTAYQFTIDGIVISSVESLTDASFNQVPGFNAFTNAVFGMGNTGEALEGQASAQPLVRIYYSQITSNTLCIGGITDIVNHLRSRTATYVYDNCIDATAYAVGEISPVNGVLHIAPNPAQDVIQISMSRFAQHPHVLTLRDQLGRIAMQIPVANGSYQIQTDITSLAPGVYTLRCEEEGIFTDAIRFIKAN